MIEVYDDRARLSIVLRAFLVDADIFKGNVEAANTTLFLYV